MPGCFGTIFESGSFRARRARPDRASDNMADGRQTQASPRYWARDELVLLFQYSMNSIRSALNCSGCSRLTIAAIHGPETLR
jgi:hypothetical protein